MQLAISVLQLKIKKYYLKVAQTQEINLLFGLQLYLVLVIIHTFQLMMDVLV
jgi:hypothetical protein